MFFFNTLRRKTAEAILGGFQDAAAVVGGLEDTTEGEAVAELRARFAAALTPAPALTAGDSPPAAAEATTPKARKAK